MKNFIIVALAALCVVLALRGRGRQSEKVVEKRDTTFITRIDTVRWRDVVYVDKWRNRTDTLVHRVNDTTFIAVPVPIDTYVFTDDTTYRAEISGYNVKLDRMEVFRRSVESVITIDRTVHSKPKRWGVGIQAGYGVTLAPCGGGVRLTPSPYIGIGISYNFIRF